MTDAHILVVDDEPDIRDLVQEILEDEGYQVSTAENAESARRQYADGQPDLVLLDIWMPDVDGISLLQEWRNSPEPGCPVVMMSGHGTVETAVEATRSGACDFIEKPLSIGKLTLTVKKALTQAGAQQRVASTSADPTVPAPLGNSPQISRLRNEADRAAQHDSTLWIYGEPGSGKETLARYIHQSSNRAAGPFISVDQVSLGGDDRDKALKRLANISGTGTLYLADITVLSPEQQSWLLSALESSENSADASARQPLSATIITSSLAPPEAVLHSGSIEERLYYRLNVLSIEVPPLRERAEDVPELVRVFAEHFAARERLPYRQFSVAAQNQLRHHGWPGNLRELKNLIRRLLILGRGDEVSGQEIEEQIRRNEQQPSVLTTGFNAVFDMPLREAREQFEREYLIHQLRKVGGSVGKLSSVVGMERTHLYRKLRMLGIDPKTITVREDNS